MPGRLEVLTPTEVAGWASHPRHPGYPMLVHAMAHGRVVGSTLADVVRPDGRPGFSLALPHTPPETVQVMLAETDEYLAEGAPAGGAGRLTVEALIGTVVRRRWVTGACHIDASAAGLLPETIVDLLCRDYLGRPAGPVITLHALARLRDGKGGHDATRRALLAASEFRHRRLYADAAPGAIFSQAMVLAMARRDFVAATGVTEIIRVSGPELLRLDGESFVAACYRQILRKEPDRDGMQHYVSLLAGGMAKSAILRHLADELEAVSSGVDLVDMPDDDGT